MSLFVREYGANGPPVIVLHGGPGGPGSAAALANGLSDGFHAYEPFQRNSGKVPLTVAQHVEDLRELVDSLGLPTPPAIAGHSWGAMLGLAFAAEYPASVSALALVGCGTFTERSRTQHQKTIDERLTDLQRDRLRSLTSLPASQSRLTEMRDLIDGVSTWDATFPDPNDEPIDFVAYATTWRDMLRLQEEGVYPGSFASIGCPVVMLHGAYDPHPGSSIRTSLEQYLPQLEYHEISECGHYPGREREARERFFRTLSQWLAEHRDEA